MNLKRFTEEFLEMLKYIVLLGLVAAMFNDFFGRSAIAQAIQALAIIGAIYGALHTENSLWVENIFIISALVLCFIPGSTGVFTPRAIPFVITLGGSVVLLLIRSTGKMDTYTSLKRFPILLALGVLSVLF